MLYNLVIPLHATIGLSNRHIISNIIIVDLLKWVIMN